MANLAIKGHKNRGEEVIQILEMLGGKNELQHKGTDSNKLYIIKNGEIHLNFTIFDYCFKVFTIEEFLKKFPYKVGDKVQLKNATSCGFIYEITEMEWKYDKVEYTISVMGTPYKEIHFAEELQPYKEETFGECIAKTIDICLFGEKEKMEEQITIDIPKGYEFTRIDSQKIVLKKIKTKYPKTYEECCDVLNIETNRIIEYDECLGYRDITQYDTNLLTQIEYFRRLRICRDAYWKLAAEELGLDKPWEPDWTDNSQKKFTICYYQGEISLTNGPNVHRLLAFPTAEMRDVFYKNFKNLIEKCKELL